MYFGSVPHTTACTSPALLISFVESVYSVCVCTPISRSWVQDMRLELHEREATFDGHAGLGRSLQEAITKQELEDQVILGGNFF